MGGFGKVYRGFYHNQVRKWTDDTGKMNSDNRGSAFFVGGGCEGCSEGRGRGPGLHQGEGPAGGEALLAT